MRMSPAKFAYACLLLMLAVPAAAHGPNAPPHQTHCMGDLLNPEYDAKEAAHYITDVRYVAINGSRPMGHLSGAGATAPENELQNAEIARFLDVVTASGKNIQ